MPPGVWSTQDIGGNLINIQLSASEAFTFASGNNNPTFAPSDVNGESVDLQFMGQVPCNYWDTYGC